VHVELDDPELSRGRAAWQPKRTERLAGALEKYARLVGPANLGTVTHAGAVDWPLESRAGGDPGRNHARACRDRTVAVGRSPHLAPTSSVYPTSSSGRASKPDTRRKLLWDNAARFYKRT